MVLTPRSPGVLVLTGAPIGERPLTDAEGQAGEAAVLNERERRILSAIEQGLDQDDPDLRGRLDPARRWMPSWRTVAGGLGVVVAVGLVLLGLVGHAVVLLAVAWSPWLWHRWSRPDAERTDPPPPGTGE